MTPGPQAPFFTLVVPVLDGGCAFARSLAAIARSGYRDLELVVVDDGSTDGSAERAKGAGAAVLSTSGRRGPAAARNLGAALARGRYLFFLDADCELHADALGRAAALLRSDPALDAVFGSYDDEPPAPGAVSRYRNLLHHRVHQRGRHDAATFWAGCGAIRRSSFEAVGGFDAARYPRPSIEDIELGARLRAAGGRIRLAPDILVTHHKAWTFGSMVRTDVLARAAPWTELGLRSGGLPRDLNVGLRERASLAALVGALAAGVAALWVGWLAWAAAALALAFLLLELDLFRFLRRRGGIPFALLSVPLHAVHVLSGGLGLLVGVARHLRSAGGRRGGPADERSAPYPPSHLPGDRAGRNPAGPRA